MLIVSLNWLKHCCAISTLTLCSSISVDLTACQICLSFLTCPSCDGSIRGTFAAMSGMLRFASLGKRLRLPGGILPSLCDLFSLLSLIFSSNQDDNFFLINSLNNSVLFIKINWINQWSSCYTSWQFNPFVYIYLSVQIQNNQAWSIASCFNDLLLQSLGQEFLSVWMLSLPHYLTSPIWQLI